jgi:propionyl-CoA carboxylase alpha chain
LTEADLKPKDPGLFAAVAAVIQDRIERRERGLSGQAQGGEPGQPSDYAVFLGTVEKDEHAVTLHRGADADRVSVDGRDLHITSPWKPGQSLFEAQVDDTETIFQIDRDGAGWILTHDGGRARALAIEARHAPLQRLMPFKQPPDMSKFLLSPMPGLLVRLKVKAGDPVKAGEELAVVEAMKMENVLRAVADGTVKDVHAESGASLAVDQAILEFE